MPTSPAADAQQQPKSNENYHFTVLIRLPFPRGNFVDPPAIEWDADKDRALWDVLSRTPKGREIGWQGLAEQFNVTLPFLLQQAAWLFEQQLSQVKEQLRKASRPTSIGTSPTPGSASGSGIKGGYEMARGVSGGPRVPSILSNKPRERPASQGEGSTTNLPVHVKRHPLSRNASANTVFQTPRVSTSIPQRPLIERKPSLVQAVKTRTASDRSMNASMLHRPQLQKSQRDAFNKANRSPPLSPSSSSNSSSSSSEADAPTHMSKSRAYLRRSRYSSSKTVQRPKFDPDEDQPDSPPFLPFSDAKVCSPALSSDPSSTTHLNPRRPLPQPGSSKADTIASPATVCSSSSSMQSHVQSPNTRPVQNPLSSLSPRQRRITREGSEGSPSMGSSFSDLDDTSVTQSALEEAYAHEINHGASRMSTISQALRSRYLS